MLPNKGIPIDDADRHPIIESVQFNDELFVAVGVVGTRTIVFLFEIKEHEAESPLVIYQLLIYAHTYHRTNKIKHFQTVKMCGMEEN